MLYLFGYNFSLNAPMFFTDFEPKRSPNAAADFNLRFFYGKDFNHCDPNFSLYAMSLFNINRF